MESQHWYFHIWENAGFEIVWCVLSVLTTSSCPMAPQPLKLAILSSEGLQLQRTKQKQAGENRFLFEVRNYGKNKRFVCLKEAEPGNWTRFFLDATGRWYYCSFLPVESFSGWREGEEFPKREREDIGRWVVGSSNTGSLHPDTT